MTGNVKWLVGILTMVQMVLSVNSIVVAFVLRRVINVAMAGAQRKFWNTVILLAGVLLLQMLLSALNRFANEYTETVVENRFKQWLFSALLTGKYASVTAVHSGEWMNRLTSDTTVVAGGVTQIVPDMISMLIRLIGGLVAILWLEPWFIYILVPGGMAMLLLTYGFRKILKRLHKSVQD